MENLRSDIFLNVLCPLFDGLTLARLAGVCKRFHSLIWGDAQLKKLMNYHLIWINHPNEFMEVTQIERGIFDYRYRYLPFEGVRAFRNKGGRYGEFNDFYPAGNQIDRLIISIQQCQQIRNFLLIRYDPTEERYNLGKELGTIHRGTSIVIYF